jgi:hypothetical protein
VTPDNVAQILLHDQYVSLAGEQRVGFLDKTAHLAFSHLISRPSLSPTEIARALGPVIRSRDMMIYANRPDEEELLARIGATGAMPSVVEDFLSVVGQDLNGSKVDWFLRRNIAYSVHLDPGTGDVTAVARVRLENTAPSGGLPAYVLGAPPVVTPGANREYLSIYSPLALIDGTLNGGPIAVQSQTELGRHVYSVLVTVPAGGASDVVLRLRGHLDGGGHYRLDVMRQATVVPDEFLLNMTAPPGWTAAGPTSVPLDTNKTFVRTFVRSS